MQLLPIDAVMPSAYNPREVDPARLELVKLSLQKLGFLSPIFATPAGELISGHQRTTAARALGYTHIPVEVINIPDLNDRKAVNLLFNRATNDFSFEQTSEDVTRLLEQASIHDQAAALPDVPTTVFPCLQATSEPLAPYLKANAGRWIKYAYNVARSMHQRGINLPIVVGPDGIVVNGVGRLEFLATRKEGTAYFVHVGAEQAKFAAAMMNWLSMDFAVEKHYADLLRFNSFRRSRRVRSDLGRGFVFALIGDKPAHSFDITKQADAARWIKKFGRTIVDFGAGHLTETNLLRAAGVDVSPFEPFHITGSEEIDKPASMALTHAFLRDVASGKQFSSIFLSSVLNSVPFLADRQHILKICAALCSPATRVYAVASSVRQPSGRVLDRQFLNKSDSERIKTRLSYEPDIILGDFSTLPKVQKYHTPRTFYELFKYAFKTVKTDWESGVNVYAIAADPLPLDGLREALEFEFNLPYPDGTRMGLVDEAVRAFERRLGTSI